MFETWIWLHHAVPHSSIWLDHILIGIMKMIVAVIARAQVLVLQSSTHWPWLGALEPSGISRSTRSVQSHHQAPGIHLLLRRDGLDWPSTHSQGWTFNQEGVHYSRACHQQVTKYAFGKANNNVTRSGSWGYGFSWSLLVDVEYSTMATSWLVRRHDEI